jgi:hypothetical protein
MQLAFVLKTLVEPHLCVAVLLDRVWVAQLQLHRWHNKNPKQAVKLLFYGPTFALECFLRSGLPSCSCTGGAWPGEPVSRIQKVTLLAPAKGWKPSLAPQSLQKAT